MRRYISILMIIALLCVGVPSFAAGSEENESTTQAVSDSQQPPPATALRKGDAYHVDGFEDAPTIAADSAILMDASSGKAIYAHEAKTKRYPASITKVMTALVAIEQCGLDEIVEYPSEVVNSIEPGSSTAGISVGAKLTMEDTLYALMLVSANEAGAAIAHHISGSDKEFAKLMTSRAKELGCTGTQFRNPHGLPDEEHYTTARDMALILQKAMSYEAFRTIAGATYYKIENETLPAPIELYNHAKIMRKSSEYYYEYVEGAKTGFTQAALNTLVTYAKKDDVELICVILKDYGADNSYKDTKALYKWAFKRLKTIHPLTDYDLKAAIKEDENTDKKLAQEIEFLKCDYDKDYSILVPKQLEEDKLSVAFRYDRSKKKGRLGYIDVTSGDEVIGSALVTYEEPATVKEGKKTKGGSDDLDAADVDANRLTPGKIFSFMGRLLIAIVLILVIMRLIAMLTNNRRRKNRHSRRHSGK